MQREIKVSLKDKIEEARKYLPLQEVDTVVYHSPCWDGTCAAALVFRYFKGRRPRLIPFNYNMKTVNETDFKNKNVLVIDFCWEGELYFHVRSLVNKMLILDHHATHEARFERPPHVFDSNECGSTLTWMYIHPSTKIPRTLELIRDRDNWKNEFKEESELLYIGLGVVYPDYNPRVVADLVQDDDVLELVMEEGKTKKAERDRRVKEITSRYMKSRVKIMGVVYQIVHIHLDDFSLLSDVADSVNLQTKVDFVVGWKQLKDGRCQLSLRTQRDDIHVGNIAKEWDANGGGHEKAAGCIVTVLPF